MSWKFFHRMKPSRKSSKIEQWMNFIIDLDNFWVFLENFRFSFHTTPFPLFLIRELISFLIKIFTQPFLSLSFNVFVSHWSWVEFTALLRHRQKSSIEILERLKFQQLIPVEFSKRLVYLGILNILFSTTVYYTNLYIDNVVIP